MARTTSTQIAERKSSSFSTAPNGSSSGMDYYTTVEIIVDFHDVPENGVYRDRSYLRTELWISHSPTYKGQLMRSSDSPYYGV